MALLLAINENSNLAQSILNLQTAQRKQEWHCYSTQHGRRKDTSHYSNDCIELNLQQKISYSKGSDTISFIPRGSK